MDADPVLEDEGEGEGREATVEDLFGDDEEAPADEAPTADASVAER
jgi:hypothetical protein